MGGAPAARYSMQPLRPEVDVHVGGHGNVYAHAHVHGITPIVGVFSGSPEGALELSWSGLKLCPLEFFV
jgi:hypothetical protein